MCPQPVDPLLVNKLLPKGVMIREPWVASPYLASRFNQVT